MQLTFVTAYADADGDGYGLRGDPMCEHESIIDCDDTRAAVHPGAAEIAAVPEGMGFDCARRRHRA